ncbi:hypothetical protein [Pararhodobacter oceanensis]|uniref:hypothetical protein n=1 Tax=Pararhodobacter oceanensis TaxID=2172121 RepID=UPI0010577CFC|nr:hypothetical protein [Pararhodobacter oceanensis]
MGKGGYNGGSTIINSWSDWLSGDRKSKLKKKASRSKGIGALTTAEKEAQHQHLIKVAAERLAQTQAEFDAGTLRPPKEPKPIPMKIGKKKREKLKLAARRAKKRAEK